MADDATPLSANGNRVTMKDLEVLSLQIDNKLDKMLAAVASMQESQKSQARRFDSLEKKVEDNSEELRTGRQRTHDLANVVQGIQLRTAPLTTDISTQLAASAHTLRRGAELLEGTDARIMLSQADIDWVHATQKRLNEEDIAFLAAQRKEETRKQQELFGFQREVVYALIGGLVLVFATAVASPLVVHLLYGKPF